MVNRNADLEKIFRIEHKYIEVYPEEFFASNLNKPSIGQQLNQAAILKFRNFRKTSKTGHNGVFLEQLKEFCERNRAMFVNFDSVNNVLAIKVFGF